MSEEEYKPCKTCLDIIDTVREKEGEKYLRLVAEFENFKKRQEKEVENFKRFANEKLLKDILPIVDSLKETMFAFYNDNVSLELVGESVDITLRLLDGFLTNNNVEVFNSLGEKFDPNIHKSIGTCETNKYSDGTVVEQFRKGYKLNGRLLRPADVMISKKPKDRKEN